MAIIIDSEILKGKPIIAGTRISVEFVLELLSSGMNIDEILKEYPHLKKENVLEAIDYATKSLKHEEIIPFSAQAA
ncbi:MAG TPA: DUF433 domain-containing protein [Candidatus Nanoarchaeia archaeon]|nr:DUF433 domain-containing protein [Candidatus Nanoarchaeia archaeon]